MGSNIGHLFGGAPSVPFVNSPWDALPGAPSNLTNQLDADTRNIVNGPKPQGYAHFNPGTPPPGAGRLPTITQPGAGYMPPGAGYLPGQSQQSQEPPQAVLARALGSRQ